MMCVIGMLGDISQAVPGGEGIIHASESIFSVKLFKQGIDQNHERMIENFNNFCDHYDVCHTGMLGNISQAVPGAKGMHDS